MTLWFGELHTRTTPPRAIATWGQKLDPAGAAAIPPPTALMPQLTDDDVAWLNQQLELVDKPDVRYAREIPTPPPPSGRVPRSGTQTLATEMASGYEPPSMSLLLPRGPAPGSARPAADDRPPPLDTIQF